MLNTLEIMFIFPGAAFDPFLFAAVTAWIIHISNVSVSLNSTSDIYSNFQW